MSITNKNVRRSCPQVYITSDGDSTSIRKHLETSQKYESHSSIPLVRPFGPSFYH